MSLHVLALAWGSSAFGFKASSGEFRLQLNLIALPMLLDVLLFFVV